MRGLGWIGGSKLREAVEPEEGTDQSLWLSQIPAFWDETYGAAGLVFSPRLLERVWVANRCLQLNAQQIARMPLRFSGPPSAFVPAWVSNPDPVWFPNGVGEAIFAAVWSMYASGDAFIHVTGRYASGLPRTWTVLDAQTVEVTVKDGRRQYEVNKRPLDYRDVVQISRDPRGRLRGTSALQAYAAQAWNVIVGGETTNEVLKNLPPAVLKATRKTNEAQAEKIQNRWVERSARRRRGVPPVLPPDIDLVATNLGFTPKDLLLLESQEFDARVIATAFGVPASLLNMAVAGGLTYQNPALLGEQWWRFELLAKGGQITDALTANMLPAGQKVEFDASATFTPLDQHEEGVVAESPAALASPADQDGAVVSPIRPMEVTA